MKENTKEGIIGALVIAAGLACFIGLGAACVMHDIAKNARKASEIEVEARSQFEQEAIEHGAAEYVIADPKTGAVEFRWKEGK